MCLTMALVCRPPASQSESQAQVGSFKLDLGERLLQHLEFWLEPDKMRAPGALPVRWRAGEEPHVAAAILNLFHLLPPVRGVGCVSLSGSLEDCACCKGTATSVSKAQFKQQCLTHSRSLRAAFPSAIYMALSSS